MKRVAVFGKRKLTIRESIYKYKSLYAIILVIMAYYMLIHYVPIVMGVMISLKKMRIGSTILGAKWVGFDNFKYVLKDDEIINVISNTLEISALRLLVGFLPPIILAIFIFDIVVPSYKRTCQTIVYIPHFFSWVIVYGIFFAFFSGGGFVNGIRRSMGLDIKNFLMSVAWFRPLIVGSQVWKEVGWGTILYLAALSAVDPQLFEAAIIDGAGPLRRIWIITLPAVLPVVTFTLIIRLGNILNNDFEQILMFYNPAVYRVGDIIETWVYRVGLGSMQYGYGAAVSILKAGVSFILIAVANNLSRRLSGRSIW